MAWEKIEEMFPEGGAIINGEWLSWEDISRYDSVSTDIIKPSKEDMIEYVLRITWYSDGRVVHEYINNILKNNEIDNIPALNLYGQKVYNNILEEVVNINRKKSIWIRFKLFLNDIKIKLKRRC